MLYFAGDKLEVPSVVGQTDDLLASREEVVGGTLRLRGKLGQEISAKSAAGCKISWWEEHRLEMEESGGKTWQ